MTTIKEEIITQARLLFQEYGYDDVSMRQIASACNISVGNLTYHYAKKEDILMTIHDQVMDLYLSKLSDEWKQRTGLSGYFAIEYAFHHFIVHSTPYYRMYKQVINSPAMRREYFHKHHSLYKEYAGITEDTDTLRYSTVAMCSLEFQMMECGALSEDFEKTMRSIFETRMLFLNETSAQYKTSIVSGIEEGQKLVKEINASF